jgi:GH15 family glucan-1,4-alpha-glucosidase
MPLPIEDYAIIGDTQTAALVGRNGSIDWLCFPRFDSGACFAALLGDQRNGHWTIAPAGGVRSSSRRYQGDSMILETTWETADGTVRVLDFMPPRGKDPDVVRMVEGVSGRVTMQSLLRIRFDYGSRTPWVNRVEDGLRAAGGPDGLVLRTPVSYRGEDRTVDGDDHPVRDLVTVADFEVAEGDRVPFVLTWFPSYSRLPRAINPENALRDTVRYWRDWSAGCTYNGPWRDAVMRSLLTLKTLTYAPSGGIVAAPTTSLPEDLGGMRNWDYRYCWLRDATMTLTALIEAGYRDEAAAWREWLLRACGGDPSKVQIMYGPAGESRIPENELNWLGGYEHSRPVRVGNAAVDQFQLDVYGEVIDTLYQSSLAELDTDPSVWSLARALLDFLEGNWREPDDGLWEVRGPRRHFTHSKVMAWVAMDRAVHAVTDHGLRGPVERWKQTRQEIHDEVCAKAWDPDRRTFTQSYGSRELDASVLMIAPVGFLPVSDDRVRTTVEAIERELKVDGFVRRYETFDATSSVDGLSGTEGAFLACSFWLADNYALLGRRDEAKALFERLLGLRNDVGLLAEEYDVARGRLVGNFPQAFSHVPLVNTAMHLSPGQSGRTTAPGD